MSDLQKAGLAWDEAKAAWRKGESKVDELMVAWEKARAEADLLHLTCIEKGWQYQEVRDVRDKATTMKARKKYAARGKAA